MSDSNSFTHLTLEERRIILTGITNGSTKTAVARTIGKDKSTVAKEICCTRKSSLTTIRLLFFLFFFVYCNTEFH